MIALSRRLSMFRPILWILTPALALAQGGTLHGVLRLAEGTPLADFPIAITRTPPPVFDPKFEPWTRTVFTNADGAFEFAAIPEGTYRVCPQKSMPGYLNPCFWSESTAPPRVAAGQRTAVPPLRLLRAQSQVIRVEDPGGLLGQTRVPDRGGPVVSPRHAMILGMFTPAGYFLTGRLAREMGTAKEYVVDVPENGRFRFNAASATLQLADGLGQRVDSRLGLSQSVDLITGKAPTPILIQVQGLLAAAPPAAGQ
jgi:hypothetical protein